MNTEELVRNLTTGDRRALARAITLIENGTEQGRRLLDDLGYTGKSVQVIGITGPPGSGKSTLVDQLITTYRKKNLNIAILAVDPTSPFSGGALLGDRIRMLRQTSDRGVYIRSLASRGRLGGLSPHTYDILILLQHAGFDRIIVETVGAGQSEIDIVRNADTTIVLTVPGMGDDIQIIKAGIMEIADIFVVNKSDLDGSERLRIQIKNMLELIPSSAVWDIPIVTTSATKKTGIEELVTQIDLHFNYLKDSGQFTKQRRDQLEFELTNKFQSRVYKKLQEIKPNPIHTMIDQLLQNTISISDALEYLVKRYATAENELGNI